MKKMISYAQNFEDVMLARAFAEFADGFYVDVGAWDPLEHSVTAHFYAIGWRGVNVEPSPVYAQALRLARPRDVTLEVAIAAATGRLQFHLFEGSGCSTTDPAMVKHDLLTAYQYSKIEVDTLTLNHIFEAHAPADVHFLKLDCEGSERAALEGLDLRRYRPWIILAEATRPLTQILSHDEWEPILRESGYGFVYFDGLNRFYIATEHAEALTPAFRSPPNIFDNFEIARYYFEISRLKNEVAALQSGAALDEKNSRQ